MAEQSSVGGSVEHWISWAHASIDQGRPQQAVTAYVKALEITPDDPELQSELGGAYQLAGDPDKAVALHRRALDADPDRWEFRFRLANAYLAREQADLALPLLDDLRREMGAPGGAADTELRDAVHHGVGDAVHLLIGDELTVLPDGARIVTLESQANAVLRLLDRTANLHIADPELRELLDQDQRMANQALEVVWYWPKLFREGRELFSLRLMPWYHDDGFLAGLRALGFFFAVVVLGLWGVVSVVSPLVELSVGSVVNVLVWGGVTFAFVWLTCRKPTWELVGDAHFAALRQRRRN